jgi:hypothetical protein
MCEFHDHEGFIVRPDCRSFAITRSGPRGATLATAEVLAGPRRRELAGPRRRELAGPRRRELAGPRRRVCAKPCHQASAGSCRRGVGRSAARLIQPPRRWPCRGVALDAGRTRRPGHRAGRLPASAFPGCQRYSQLRAGWGARCTMGAPDIHMAFVLHEMRRIPRCRCCLLFLVISTTLSSISTTLRSHAISKIPDNQ